MIVQAKNPRKERNNVMAKKESYLVEWTEDGKTRKIRVSMSDKQMVIEKGRGVRVNIDGQKVGIRKDRKVKGVELLKSFDPDGINLLPRQVPEETVILTHQSPRCVNIPTRNGWVRW